MYWAQCTRPNISFYVNLFIGYSSAPTKRHWTGIKHILRCLCGTTDLEIFYSYDHIDPSFVGYADSGYLSLILIKVDHRQVMCFLVVMPPFFGVLLNRLW